MDNEDFKQYVDTALENTDLAAMRLVVEKELLHYEIFNALDEVGLLKNLVFQGGTSLRLCRGSERFSEDLDFAGGRDFSAASMEKIKECITQRIADRFGLEVVVKEPKPAKLAGLVHVDKWTVNIQTNPGARDVPRQKIKLEIANVTAYSREAIPLRLNYSVLEGMNRVVVVTESIHEILADKVIALPTSIAKIEGETLVPTPTRIRHRDIWDLAWLVGQGAVLDIDLVNKKISDYGIQNFERFLDFAIESIEGVATSDAFKSQMQRFIKKSAYDSTFGKTGYDAYLGSTVNKLLKEARSGLMI